MCAQFWHLGGPAVKLSPRSLRIGDHTTLALSDFGEAELSEGEEYGWRSPAPGHRIGAPVLRVHGAGTSPVKLAAVLCLDEQFTGLRIDLVQETATLKID